MIPNINITPNTSTSNSIIGSRAYTFLDSYVYMKNQRYNAMYEKNKEILAIEHNAISLKSANVLYNAFLEQAKILDSVILRIRNFVLRIKPDVIENLELLMPSKNAVEEFLDAISTTNYIPKYKYLKYDIKPIKYENMASFMTLYKMEVKSFTNIDTQTAVKTNPFLRDKAVKYLIDTASTHANVNTELLEMEDIKIINPERLKSIYVFFKHKNRYISTVRADFKTFLFYLRQYSGLKDIVNGINPTEINNDLISLSSGGKAITFNDYFVLYKHFSDMIKYMIKIISYHEQQFFNKIYALQGNIESYVSILNEVLDYADKQELDKSIIDDTVLNEFTFINKSNFDNIKSSINESVNFMDDFDPLDTPELIQKYMENNISYDASSNWKLRSPNETMNDKKGNCHDQSLLSMYLLKKIDKPCGQLFYIEYNDNEESGDRTHTLTWYVTRGKVYWMENAWGSQKGIHGPYNDIKDLKKAIVEIHLKEPEAKRYPKLEFGTPSGIKVGMNLSEYVKKCLDKKTLNESASYTKISIKKFKEIRKEDRLDTYYDIMLDDSKIGTIATSYYEDENALGIGSFEIDKEYRGNGYGTIVIKNIINSNRDKKTIYCYVDSNNEGAIKLYKKLGKVFDEDKSKKQYYVEFFGKNIQNESFNDIYNLVNGNDQANILLNDDSHRIKIFSSGDFSKYRKEDLSDNYADITKDMIDKQILKNDDEISEIDDMVKKYFTPDTISGIKDEDISNFQEFEGTPGEVNSLCTMKNSLNL